MPDADDMETINVGNRRRLLAELRAAIVGPDPCPAAPGGEGPEAASGHGPAGVQADGEEILPHDSSPRLRYGAGVLHPPETPHDASDGLAEASGDLDAEATGTTPATTIGEPDATVEGNVTQVRDAGGELEDYDFELAATNGYRPSAIGTSMVIDMVALGKDELVLEIAGRVRSGAGEVSGPVPCGFYVAGDVPAGEGQRSRRRWLRRPLLDAVTGAPPAVTLDAERLGDGGCVPVRDKGFPGQLDLRWSVRGWPGATGERKVVTFSLVHRGAARGKPVPDDALVLCQSAIAVTMPEGALCEWPGDAVGAEGDDDVVGDRQVNRLLYSARPVHAVGHGCVADWSVQSEGHVTVWTDVMPVHEMPPVSFDVRDEAGAPVMLSMRELTGTEAPRTGAIARLGRLVELYEQWIAKLSDAAVPGGLEETAAALRERATRAAARMRTGIGILDTDPVAWHAFALANEAMLMAQHRRPGTPRKRDGAGGDWSGDYGPLDLDDSGSLAAENDPRRPVGNWRPFQIAFILMSIEGCVNEESEDRETVDLIWFPTGGGKTEAYLGLAAFTVFHGALTGRVSLEIQGARSVQVLMRYTLRLLTAQQFQRAVTLFCAMELLRRRDPGRLGQVPFRVGLWAGRSVTPNSMEEASKALGKMRGNGRSAGKDADNPFVLMQCPWCSAEFGTVGSERKARDRTVSGYEIVGERRGGHPGRLRYRCPDPRCEFSGGEGPCVPADVVDETLYANPPTLLIGTVDKFAMLAWNDKVRALFGIDPQGRATVAGPALVVQDELHLLTGPLGTMVGLFETAVDGLCRHDGRSPPRIVASTATAGRALDQVRAIYARRDLCVFPPPGVDASDSFFAREDTGRPGRLYAGVLAPGHGSMQTSQRVVYGSLMQGVADLAAAAPEGKAAEHADPWWTVLAYYNSLRELGGALTLFSADVIEEIGVIAKRKGIAGRLRRRPNLEAGVRELTGRISSGEVPAALGSLERPLEAFASDRDELPTVWPKAWDVLDACLASNIIEVGVDVPRLSLMTVIGQPKTTSSYIQASSRVGRRSDRPGLVVVLYSSTKPRDRSHYERFRAYHQSIYAWVEATSTTPFSKPAVSRSLHAALVAMMRQMSPADATPADVAEDADLYRSVLETFQERAAAVGRKDEVENVSRRLEELFERSWRHWSPDSWGSFNPDDDREALIYPAGSAGPAWRDRAWATQTSLRNVDTSCEAAVTQFYLDDDRDAPGTGNVPDTAQEGDQ